MNRVWKTHVRVVGAALTLAGALTAVVWLHPTFGYAQSGILRGADLRADMTQLIGWLVAAFCIASTLTLAASAARVSAPVAYGLSYVLGVTAAVGAMPILDKFY